MTAPGNLWRYWTTEGLGIDDLLDAAIGEGRVYADRQLVVTRTLDPYGLKFSGEIDITNSNAVAESLSMTPGGGVDLHLDVGGLIFCDISGVRSFVDAARHRQGGRLVLHGLPRPLQTVIRVTGWAELPHLAMCDGGGEG